MLNLLLAESGGGSSWWIYVILLVAVVFLLVFPMFNQKKRNKEFGEMVNGLSVGDEIRTIGGIIGKITKINKEDGVVKTIIIETGAANAKHTLELDVTCIAYILNQVNPPKKEDPKKEEPKTEDVKKDETELSANNQENKEDSAEKTKNSRKTSKKSAENTSSQNKNK